MESDDISAARQARYRDATAHLDRLPLLPAVVTRLMLLDPGDDHYFETVQQLGEQDPPFAARLIRLANSSAFRPPTPIVDLRSAITWVGARQIAMLVTSLAVMRIFVPGPKAARDLWLHSIQVALAARTIAQRFFRGKVAVETAYLCGLLHDIGRFIALEVAQDQFDGRDEEGWDTAETLIDIELRVLGIPHTELGTLVCRKWLLPDVVAKVVRLHHVRMVASAAGDDLPLRDLLSVVWLADHFSLMILYRGDLSTLPPGEATELLHERCVAAFKQPLPLTAADLYEMIPDVVGQAVDFCRSLGLQVD